MIRSFSPFTRRLIALAILLFVLLAAMNLLLALWSGTRNSMAELEDARFRLARLVALQSRPAPAPGASVPSDLYFAAPTHEAAAQLASAAVATAAANVQLPLESLAVGPPDKANPQLARMSLAAAGPEPTVLGFVAELEKVRPAVRLESWRLSRTGSEPNSLRVEAIAAAAWSGPQ